MQHEILTFRPFVGYKKRCMRALPHFRFTGFTMIEVLAVLAGLAIIGGIGYVTISETKTNAEATKLESDVASINRSIQIFESNGGDLTGVTGADDSTGSHSDVLTKLKTRGDSSKILGVTGSTLDARVYAVYQTAEEASSGSSRAVWNASARRFDVVTSGGAGVKEFRLNEELASETPVTDDSRTTAKETSTGNGWVWEHGNPSVTVASSGYSPETGTAVNPSIASFISSGLDNGVKIVGPNGTVTTDDKYYDGAGYAGTLGIFSLDGMGNPPYDLTTAAGLLAFMREAVRRVAAGGTQGGVAMTSDGDGKELTFTPGTAVAFILIPNGTFSSAQTYLAGTSPSTSSNLYPLTSLSFDTGDVTGFSQSQAVDLGNDVMAIEDLAGGGDRDYEDIVWKTSGLTQPDWSTLNTVDPATYYSDWDNPNTATVEHINRLDVTGDTLLDGSDPTLREALQNAGALP